MVFFFIVIKTISSYFKFVNTVKMFQKKNKSDNE
jgi:hypothetical protein